MSKITDASFIAHQYTSVSRNVPKKANRYTLFRESPALVPDSPVGPAFRSIPRPFDGHGETTPTRIDVAVADMAISLTACPERRKARRRARHIPEPWTIPRLPPAGFPYFETSIAPAAFRSGLPSRSGPASFRSMRCNRCKPVTRHVLPPEGAENAYSRPQALRSASARSVASQVNSGSSRPKWP